MPQMRLTVGSLFSGIGGFDLGFERAGYQIMWQVEIDDYCQRVLAKHWPHVKRYGDIRTITDIEYVDVLCGGFPCQDISNAGKREGIDGARSGLWSEFLRIIRMVRPRYVVVENVAALLNRGMGRVLGDLSESGYDAEWDCIPASAVGAPHRRDRVWLVAHASQCRMEGECLPSQRFPRIFNAHWPSLDDANTDSDNGKWGRGDVQMGGGGVTEATPGILFGAGDQWRTEPNVGRMAHGIPSRVDRLKGLGNALVPQIAEWIARQILVFDR